MTEIQAFCTRIKAGSEIKYKKFLSEKENNIYTNFMCSNAP